MDTISIIVPVYNVEEYLRKCVESILSQSYHLFELILVDDGSTDGSGVLCDELGRLDSRIRVIHKDNGGLSDARNRGIEVATGKYIMFVDSDDYVLPQMCECLLNAVKKYKCQLAICDFLKVYSDNVDEEKDEIDINKVSCTKMKKEDAYNPFFYKERYVQFEVAWNKLYDRELFDGVRFPIGKIHEDTATTYLLLYKAKGIVYIDTKLYCYRQRNNSIMGARITKKSLDGLDALQQKLIFYSEKKEARLYTLAFLYYKFLILDYMRKWEQYKIGNKHDFDKYICFFQEQFKSNRSLLEVSKIKKIIHMLFASYPNFYFYLYKRKEIKCCKRNTKGV